MQVREDDGASSLQPIMLDSLISSVPSLSPAPPLNGVRRKVGDAVVDALIHIFIVLRIIIVFFHYPFLCSYEADGW